MLFLKGVDIRLIEVGVFRQNFDVLGLLEGSLPRRLDLLECACLLTQGAEKLRVILLHQELQEVLLVLRIIHGSSSLAPFEVIVGSARLEALLIQAQADFALHLVRRRRFPISVYFWSQSLRACLQSTHVVHKVILLLASELVQGVAQRGSSFQPIGRHGFLLTRKLLLTSLEALLVPSQFILQILPLVGRKRLLGCVEQLLLDFGLFLRREVRLQQQLYQL